MGETNDDYINGIEGKQLYESLFADKGSREQIRLKDWVNGWSAIVGGFNGIPTSRQFNALQYITDLKILLLYQDFERFKTEILERIEKLTGQNGELTEVVKPLIKYTIATNQDIDDILDAVYEDDMDFQSLLDIATNRDIDNMIAGIYENEAEEDGADMATDEDIDNIIAGTYVEDEDAEEYDATGGEIERIIENAFKEDETEEEYEETFSDKT